MLSSSDWSPLISEFVLSYFEQTTAQQWGQTVDTSIGRFINNARRVTEPSRLSKMRDVTAKRSCVSDRRADRFELGCKTNPSEVDANSTERCPDGKAQTMTWPLLPRNFPWRVSSLLACWSRTHGIVLPSSPRAASKTTELVIPSGRAHPFELR